MNGYGPTQLVLAESDGSDPSYRRDLRRDNSWYFAGAGMADAGRSSLQWSFASAICGHDGSRPGDQGTFRLLGLFGRWGSFSSSLLRRISIQHRSTAAIFALRSVTTLAEALCVFLTKRGNNPLATPQAVSRPISRRQYRRKTTSMLIWTATGRPSLSAGSKRHLLTASVAFSSRPMPSERAMRRFRGWPSASMIAQSMTLP